MRLLNLLEVMKPNPPSRLLKRWAARPRKGKNMSLKEQASRAISLLTLYEIEGDSIQRIIDVVQNNNSYFGANLGDSCLEAAAKKLEFLVSEASQPPLKRTRLNSSEN